MINWKEVALSKQTPEIHLCKRQTKWRVRKTAEQVWSRFIAQNAENKCLKMATYWNRSTFLINAFTWYDIQASFKPWVAAMIVSSAHLSDDTRFCGDRISHEWNNLSMTQLIHPENTWPELKWTIATIKRKGKEYCKLQHLPLCCVFAIHVLFFSKNYIHQLLLKMSKEIFFFILEKHVSISSEKNAVYLDLSL